MSLVSRVEGNGGNGKVGLITSMETMLSSSVGKRSGERRRVDGVEV